MCLYIRSQLRSLLPETSQKGCVGLNNSLLTKYGHNNNRQEKIVTSYVVTYKSDGVIHRERMRAISEEEAKSKSRSRHHKYKKFDIVSVELASKNRPINPSNIRVVPTFKQFTCSFGVMNNRMYEVHQIALYELDEASAKETLKSRYLGIVENSIRIVEAR